MKRILLLTDFSENARNAIIYGLKLFGDKAEYTLLNACQEPSEDTDVLISIQDILRDASEKALAKDIEFIQEALPEREPTIETRTEYGAVERVLDTISGAESFDFVVMGTKGTTSDRWFVGSVAKSAVQHSPFPVIVVPENAKFKGVSTVAYATNLNDDESILIEYLVDFAKYHAARLSFLHIDKSQSLIADSMKKFSAFSEKLTYDNINYVELVHDDIENAIIEYTEENNVDLLAVTTYTTTLMKRLFNHSVTRELMLHTHIPMLVFNRKKYSYIFLG